MRAHAAVPPGRGHDGAPLRLRFGLAARQAFAARFALAVLALAACGGGDPGPAAPAENPEARLARERETAELLPRIEEDAAFDRVVELKAAGPVVEFTRTAPHGRPRLLASVALGRIGGDAARDRLLELLAEDTKDPRRDGATQLYAAAGLTLLADPGTAVDLLLRLSSVNPNDNVAPLSLEGTEGEYFTVDAQIGDALLGMGLWDVEEDLVDQMKRRAWVRVLIDAHAVLRRRAGLDLPFRYNGSYADREADAEAWRAKLRETRAERRRARPFDARNARFREGCARMVAWIGGQSVSDRYIAEKVLVRLGHEAVPYLLDALPSGNRVAQREAALLLGRIGDPAAAGPLRAALSVEDDDARASVVDALRLLGDREARGAVLAALGDRDPEVRAAAARYLERLGGEQDVEPLRAAVAKEPSPSAATAMLCALLRHGDAAARPRLVEVFVKGEMLDRVAAFEALARARPGWQADPRAPEEARARAAEEFEGG